jgi:hypothetical protein
MAETDMQQDDNYDARFEFDAPRFYDFEKMSGGTPVDKWFDTAPDGPGCKPERKDIGPNMLCQLPAQKCPGCS